MKQTLSCLYIWVFYTLGAYAVDDSSLLSNSNAKKTMRRVNSEANMLLFEENNKLPHMSRSEYIKMMEKFLADNSYFLDFSNLMSKLKFRINVIDESLARVMERFPKIKKLGDNKIDISCPRIVESAMARLADVKAKKPDIVVDTTLTMENLKWILENFDKHLKDIQAHGDMPVVHYNDNAAPYDSGLSDSDIELLIGLTIGEHRLFEISGLTEDERREFIDLGMKPMLRNATGFQHVISLIVVSIFNQADGIANDHINIKALKGSEGSYLQDNEVNINKADDSSFDMTLFHETRHAFHRMLGLYLHVDELISNISIVNSDNINLIDQFFPMLRPSVMLDAVAKIQKFIEGYWGSQFEHIDQTDRNRLIVLFLEPALRNIVVSGFGSLIPYCKDWATKSLTVTEDALTSENMAWCIYLSTILNKSILAPQVTKSGDIIIPTIQNRNYNQGVRPAFYNLRNILFGIIEEVNVDVFGRDSLWNTTEEKLCMQGSTLYQTSDGYSYYIQDKQNEHIYLTRSGKHDPFVPILYRYRFHQERSGSLAFAEIFKSICECISSLGVDGYQKIVNTDVFLSLSDNIGENFIPSLKNKYSINEKESKSAHSKNIPVDEKTFKKFSEAMDVDKLDSIYGGYRADVSHKEDCDNFVMKKVQALIDRDLPVNVRDARGLTPLLNALNKGFLKTAQLLIENDANIHARGADDNTIMHFLNPVPDFPLMNEVIRFLLENNADINAKNRYGKTPLHHAIDNAYPRKDIIAALIENGADVDAVDYDGNTPMHTATQNGCTETIDISKLLLAKGADINALNHKRETPLFGLLSYNNKDMVAIINALEFMLNHGAKVDAKNNTGNTIFHVAINRWDDINDIDRFITCLLKHGADINCVNYSGSTPLHLAVTSHRLDVIKFLIAKGAQLKHGADINCVNYSGNTPLHLAVTSHRLDIIKFLIAKGAQIDIKNCDGCTPIGLAIRLSWNEAVEFFINNIDINSKDATDIFRSAVEEDNVDVIKILESKGFDVKKQYSEFNTLELAIEHNANEVAKLFIDGIDATSPYAEKLLRLAVVNSNFYALMRLIDKGVNVNTTDDDGNTVVHLAVSNFAKAFKDSLKNRQDLEDITLRILMLIMRSGVDLNKANNQGIIPIQLILLSEDKFTLLNEAIDLAINLYKMKAEDNYMSALSKGTAVDEDLKQRAVRQHLLTKCKEIVDCCKNITVMYFIYGMESVRSFLVQQYARNRVKEAARDD